ncbi:hypothetical protein [Heyndrickxia sporothermodurans]|uniref:hypothetical protein n=1 Tax=Heyndrickxia sporothermodurans TaxID=46224 RepID=UPI002E23D66B|nr:hypothetical protein [Heyndrickxia sporothermodurans]MED3699590.1 hypothetical protein [Heyndrickxia sporothermodurans]
MKKIILSLTAGAFLIGGVLVMKDTQNSGDSKNIAAGGEREPSVLSIKVQTSV